MLSTTFFSLFMMDNIEEKAPVSSDRFYQRKPGHAGKGPMPFECMNRLLTNVFLLFDHIGSM